ncbi:MAG: hypothetical protein HY689_00145 [Chloroflexi bacterium]|nr:hypothetical protein [Chloroflexota bacterium]
MNIMRCTIVDPQGTVSFIAPCDAAMALMVVCAHNPRTLEELLTHADTYYPSLKEYVWNGLAVFDERNVPGGLEVIRRILREEQPTDHPVFRVVDDVTREASLQPVKAGGVVINLRAKRIVQIQNSYQEITRSGRVRVFDGSRPGGRTVRYRLPDEWSLVP